MKFSGSDLDASDKTRLKKQYPVIFAMMRDGQWRTVREIAEATGFPENSIQAQLRNMRKPEFGKHQTPKQRRNGGLWEYRLIENKGEVVND